MDRDGDRERSRLEGRLERADHVEVGFEAGQAPFPLECLEQPDRSPEGEASSGRIDLDIVEPDDGIDVEVADVEALADDLAVDLTLGRYIDDHIAAQR